MILPNEFWKRNIELMKITSFNYLVMNLENYQYSSDKIKLEPGLDIANLCNILRMVNDSFENAGIDKKIDFSILGEVLISIYTNTPLNDEQVRLFFALDQNMEKNGLVFSRDLQYYEWTTFFWTNNPTCNRF